MRKGTLAYSVILLAILVSLVAFSPASAATIVGSAKFEPKRVDLSLSAPSVVKAEIHFESDGQPRWINISTVLLEGSLAPDSAYMDPLAVNTLIAEFDGQLVINIIWGKITHLGALAPPYKIWLTITGNLKDEYGGTPFSCIGSIKIIVHHTPPPPPPPT
ncbi:MAG: hypothetical protein JSV85_07130 [Candidatus Bathyarchaeota archaeon]|nr:MAG: hypothetical protein JSV85_07130 [Candidatus Bathyarchaeota archaeon]